MGPGTALTLFFAVQTVGSIKCDTAFQSDCTEKVLKKGEAWQLSHLTGCAMDEAQKQRLLRAFTKSLTIKVYCEGNDNQFIRLPA